MPFETQRDASPDDPQFADTFAGNSKLAVRLSIIAVVLLIGAVVAAVSHVGCRDESVSSVKQRQRDRLFEADQGQALLKAASSQFNDLPAAVDTEVRPPVVILDSRKSGDGQDVFAICIANPKVPNSPINIVHAVNNNGRFKSIAVSPGDILKFFVLEDKTVDEDSRKVGLSRQKAMDLKIARVLDENTLLIEGGLNQVVDFPAKIEIWRNVDDRLKEINEKLTAYIDRRLPAVGWEPAPDDRVLTQILTWLNQWVRQSSLPADWQAAPLLETLDKKLVGDADMAKRMSKDNLAARTFLPSDSRILQEAIWLRDISNWAHGDGFDDLSRASALFDWTIRNIQLESADDAPPRRPWHTLLFGRGTAEQRAWVFALLCRQQGMNVVMLRVPTAKSIGDKAAASSPHDFYWLAALLSNKQLYLFDTQLGLAIAGPNGQGVATLDQALKDDSLLRKLDIDGEPYALNAESLKNARAFVVADPFELSRRALQLESSLAGSDRLVLAARPTELAEQLKTAAGLSGEVGLWEFPFRTLHEELKLGKAARNIEAFEFEPFAVRPALWKARTRQFQGRRRAAANASEEALDDHQEATRLYLGKSVRPPDTEIAESRSADKQRIDSGAKLNATYWLGLMSFDDGKPEVAANWFTRPELTRETSPWFNGARYNLARSLEAQQKFDEAIALLEKDTSPQQHGNKVRARELKSRPAPSKPTEAAK